ncbi:MAG: Sir2 family NAD-dependent protein deacetylase, partial [Rhodanobacter sp.]
NRAWQQLQASVAPDGDADLKDQDFSRFEVPPCPHCGGIVKPDVVFFGEGVPRERVDAATQALRVADAVLVVGSSLMVYSGYRFVLAAVKAGQPVAALTLGRTRADALLSLKIDARCSDALAFVLAPRRLMAN